MDIKNITNANGDKNPFTPLLYGIIFIVGLVVLISAISGIKSIYNDITGNSQADLMKVITQQEGVIKELQEANARLDKAIADQQKRYELEHAALLNEIEAIKATKEASVKITTKKDTRIKKIVKNASLGKDIKIATEDPVEIKQISQVTIDSIWEHYQLVK